MFKNKTSIDKKKALLARKEQILLDLQYYEARIPEYTSKSTRQYYCSSDSEDDTPFPPFTLQLGPSLGELRKQEHLLKTCLQATLELSGLAVLQSEVNVLVQDPLIKGERPVSEPGTWREVMAECRIDSVPFSITFYTHQPSRKCAPTYYRGLHVLPVRKAQEAELARSVLSGLTRPSDAIEVLRSYAAAFRSRRNTLARLADRYTNKLLLERLPEGGFLMKCANVLSLSWTLENKHSAVADFHHKMCFDLEYMDESYIKKIKPEHRKLADPSLETDERTLILSNIIIICLEAQTQTQEMYESVESDQESVKIPDKTTLSEDIDENEDIDKRKRDEEVMAPPKTIPKKGKPKGKENNDDNRKSVKRTSEDDGQNAKKAKIDAVDGKSITVMVKEKEISEDKNTVKKTNDKEKNNQKGKSITDIVKGKELSEGSKNKVKNTTDKEHMNKKGNDEVVNDKVDKEQKKQKITEKTVVKKQMNQKKPDKVVDKPQTVEKGAESSAKQSKAVAKNVEKAKNSDNSDKQKNNERSDKNNEKKTEKVQTQSKVTDKSEKQKINDAEKPTNEVNAKNSINTEKNSNKGDDQDAGSKQAKITKDNPKNTVEKDLNAKKVANSDAKNGKNDVPQLKNNVEKDSNPKAVSNVDKTSKAGQNDKVIEKNRPKSNIDPKSAKTLTQNAKITKTANNTEKADKENKNDNQTTNTKNHKALINKPKEKNSAVKAISTTEKTNTLPRNDPKIFQAKIDTKNKMPDTINKMADTLPKNAPKKIFQTKTDTINKMPNTKNKMADTLPKKIFQTKTDTINKMPNTKNRMADSKNKMVAAKDIVKPKMVLPNNRNSNGVKKTISKATVYKERTTVLQKNPVRASPRMISKFKSSSATNIQTKIFKPSTNIPRLLKQTTRQSK